MTQRLIRGNENTSVERFLQRETTLLHPVEINQLIYIFCIFWFGCIIAWIFYLCELLVIKFLANFEKKKRDNRKKMRKTLNQPRSQGGAKGGSAPF